MNNYFDKQGNYINCENLSLAEIYHRAFALGVESVAIDKRQQGDLISRSALKEELQAQHDFYINSWEENGVAPKDIPIPDKSRIDEITTAIAMVINAPTVDIPNYGGRVVPDTLHGWKYEERPQGDLISREALIKWIDDSVSQYGHTYSTDMLNMWGLFKDYLINNAPTVEPDTDFAKWVTEMIFGNNEVEDFDFELFSELACRKLEKLGLVKKTESEWIRKAVRKNELV